MSSEQRCALRSDVRRRRGHGRGITRRVNSLTTDKLFYAHLCEDAHGDPAPITRLAIPDDPGTVQLEPRRGIPTRGALLFYASIARDLTVAIAQLARIPLTDIDEFDQEMHAALDAP